MFENSHTIFGARNVYGGSGEFHGGDIEVFSGGYIEVIFFGGGVSFERKKNRVQSPESRVQGPGSRPAFRICPKDLQSVDNE